MLDINVDVIKGIMFIQLEGDLNESTIKNLESELNYLLYKQGMHFFVFNFNNIEHIEHTTIHHLQNKLIEIFLNCGKVAMCGLNDLYQKKLGMQERLHYVSNEREALDFLSI